MTLVVNGERIENEAIEDARRQLLSQQTVRTGTPEWEARGIDVESFAKQMVIARILIGQEAKANSPPVSSKDIERELKQIREAAGSEENFQRFLDERGIDETHLRADLEQSIKVDRLLEKVCKDVSDPTLPEMRAHY
ncbi:MAG TPA: hypothetical protein ENN80_11635, partial [Candidatus Hydrogenedentes bacterium]|nr:hypothetical protein [Candidatus Hydrogenedentota bacterium]